MKEGESLQRIGTFTCLEIPATGQLRAVRIDLSLVYDAERRIPEIQFVKKETAAGILADFMQGYGQANNAHALVSKLLAETENAAKRRRAYVVLDKAPEILKEKGLVTARNPTGSEDLRNSVLELDEEYQQLVDRISFLVAVKSLIAGKMKNLQMAYDAVKKIITPDSNFFRPDTSINPDEIGNYAIGDTGFGKPRY